MSNFCGRIVKNKIYSKKIKSQIRTVILADLHNSTNNINKTQRLIQAINELHADIILIAGDIFNTGNFWNNKKSLNNLKNFIKEISYNSYVCITLGNHDIYKINNKNRRTLLRHFYSLKNVNTDKVFPLYNESTFINGIEVISYVPRFELMSGEGLKKQIHGQAHEEFIADYHKKGIKFDKEKNYNIFLGYDPHLIAPSENGKDLLELASADLFIAGHLHDGYKFLFKHIERLKTKLTGKGLKSLEFDSGWVEQPTGIIDKNGNKVKKIIPSFYGKTDLCRGIIYFDDECNNRIWQSADDNFFKDGKQIKKKEAIKFIIDKNLNAQLISDGITPALYYIESLAVINVVDIIPFSLYK